MYTIIKASRMEVFDNRSLRLTPAQVKDRTGCTHITNGWVFNKKFQLCDDCIVSGKVLSKSRYSDWGLGCGASGGPEMTTDRTLQWFTSAVPILKDGKKLKRNLTPDVARPAERTAVGWLKDGHLLLWCDRAILTREQLQDKLLALGCVDALMMDGGGSTQGVFPSGKVTSSRIVATYLCFWAENNEKEETKVEQKKKVCLDAGHSASNKVNKSPDGTYFEHEFALDMAKRIKAHLERHGVEVVETRPDGGDVSMGQRCRISNAAKPDLFVSLHSNATGTLSTAKDGWGNARGWECYVYGLSGARYKAAKAILTQAEGVAPAIRSTPIWAKPDLYVLAHTNAPAVLIEHGFHTSKRDVAYLKDSAYREKLAAAEARGILEYLGVAWKDVSDLDTAVDKLVAAGIINSPDRWKKLDFTENSVRLLIIKMAAALK